MSGMLFLDSGAFTLVARAAQYKKEHLGGEWDFYSTAEARQYLDDYAAFIKQYQTGIDLYANVDVIGNPELTWRNQQYLEKRHGLKPVPVIHCGTDLVWLDHYTAKGYTLVGLGGLVGKEDARRRLWLDGVFDVVCDNPQRLPSVRLHGFGVTAFDLLWRYPWWSVDSASWTKIGSFGGVIVPHKRGGKFIFCENPYIMKVSDESPDGGSNGKHINTISGAERAILVEWLQQIGIPLGKTVDGEAVEAGVVNGHTYRRAANLLFFEELRKAIPPYPWPFRPVRRKGFGVR